MSTSDIEVTIDTSGYDKVKEDLPKAIEAALYRMGTLAVGGAVYSISGRYKSENAAVDTGRLRASLSFITPEQKGSGAFSGESKDGDQLSGKSEKNTVIIGSNVNYAEFVHNGTSKMRARPFLREGIDNTREEMEKAVREILEGRA